jgi:poly-gamma-glutamate synthesis protein (capsule biosynthesis protein)
MLFLAVQLNSEPPSTTVAVSASTTLATTSMSSTSVKTTPTTTAATETTTAGQPFFQSSIGPIAPAAVSSSWREGCPLDVASLRGVDVSHFGYDGEVHTGRLVVAEDVAEDLVAIMSRLFEAGFPIERMEPIDAYGGDDDLSMAANNTSAFNCRPVTGGSSWSEHSYGSAIDVNPLVNPYVMGGTVLPPEGAAYADRTIEAPGMIHDGDLVVQAFASHGWIWGGTWSSPKDYQHFSTSGR